MFADATPDGLGASGSRLSNSTTALLLASRPVTTRRISDAMAGEQASARAAAGQNVIFSSESSPVYRSRPDAVRVVRNDPDGRVLNVWARHSTMAENPAG